MNLSHMRSLSEKGRKFVLNRNVEKDIPLFLEKQNQWIRIRWNLTQLRIEELRNGNLKLYRSDIDTSETVRKLGSPFLIPNILDQVPLSMKQDYSDYCQTLREFLQTFYRKVNQIPDVLIEKKVHYMKVAPADMKPIYINGTHFNLESSWYYFRVEEVGGRGLVHATPLAARSFYQDMPHYVDQMTWEDLRKWLMDSGIRFHVCSNVFPQMHFM